MTTPWRVRLYLLSLVALLLIGFGSSWAVLYAVRRNAAEVFKPHMPEYLAPAKGVVTAPAKGKMVIVDKATQDIDWDVFFDLPDGLRAATPEEVGMVVWLEYRRTKVGAYQGGAPAFRQTCTVTVVDATSRNTIGATSVQGGDPPQSIDENAKEGEGPKPTGEVVDYLKGLPRQ